MSKNCISFTVSVPADTVMKFKEKYLGKETGHRITYWMNYDIEQQGSIEARRKRLAEKMAERLELEAWVQREEQALADIEKEKIKETERITRAKTVRTTSEYLAAVMGITPNYKSMMKNDVFTDKNKRRFADPIAVKFNIPVEIVIEDAIILTTDENSIQKRVDIPIKVAMGDTIKPVEQQVDIPVEAVVEDSTKQETTSG